MKQKAMALGYVPSKKELVTMVKERGYQIAHVIDEPRATTVIAQGYDESVMFPVTVRLAYWKREELLVWENLQRG